MRIHEHLETALTFDDVLLSPQYSTVRTRSDVDTSVKLGNLTLKKPFIAANMDTVCEQEMATAASDNGWLGIIHRNLPIDDRVAQARGLTTGIAFGVNEDYQDLVAKATDKGIPVLCLDIAHGASQHAVEATYQVAKYISDNSLDTMLIAGNVATPSGFKSLADAGANAIKVGIGGGGACSTRIVTGIGVPQFSAVLSCVQIKSLYPDMVLISDGGIRHPGDACKAIAVGADAVMMGTVLAGADEAPGTWRNGPGGSSFKEYRGMASAAAGSDYAEGKQGWVKCSGPANDTISEYDKGLRSSMSYCNATTVAEFRRNAEFLRVTPAGQQESAAHAFK